jgi:DNA-binding NarL/FixJ family response regulator
MTEETTTRITDLLNAGYSIKEVSEEVKEDPQKVYVVARKLNLPYNAPIKSGGPKEKRILRLTNSGFSLKDIGLIFKISPKIVERIIKENE